MVTDQDYRGHQTSRAIKECRHWLDQWDHDQYVPSIRITSGGPTQEQTAQVTVVAMVRHLNGKMPKSSHAFLAHAGILMKDIRKMGFGMSDGALGGVVNWSYWMLRDGPKDAIRLYPIISWIKISQRWPWEPHRGEEGAQK